MQSFATTGQVDATFYQSVELRLVKLFGTKSSSVVHLLHHSFYFFWVLPFYPSLQQKVSAHPLCSRPLTRQCPKWLAHGPSCWKEKKKERKKSWTLCSDFCAQLSLYLLPRFLLCSVCSSLFLFLYSVNLISWQLTETHAFLHSLSAWGAAAAAAWLAASTSLITNLGKRVKERTGGGGPQWNNRHSWCWCSSS